MSSDNDDGHVASCSPAGAQQRGVRDAHINGVQSQVTHMEEEGTKANSAGADGVRGAQVGEVAQLQMGRLASELEGERTKLVTRETDACMRDCQRHIEVGPSNHMSMVHYIPPLPAPQMPPIQNLPQQLHLQSNTELTSAAQTQQVDLQSQSQYQHHHYQLRHLINNQVQQVAFYSNDSFETIPTTTVYDGLNCQQPEMDCAYCNWLARNSL